MIKEDGGGKDYNCVVDFSITSSCGESCNTLEDEIFVCVCTILDL